VIGCGLGVSVGCVLLWPVLHSCVCLLVGVGVGVSGCGSWFFHSGREHLDIAIVTPFLVGGGGCGCGVLCNFVVVFLVLSDSHRVLLLCGGVV
jgi:uncharacterized spore protein YtfJ